MKNGIWTSVAALCLALVPAASRAQTVTAGDGLGLEFTTPLEICVKKGTASAAARDKISYHGYDDEKKRPIVFPAARCDAGITIEKKVTIQYLHNCPPWPDPPPEGVKPYPGYYTNCTATRKTLDIPVAVQSGEQTPLAKYPAAVTKAVIVLNGATINPQKVFDMFTRSMPEADDATTWLVAPQFLADPATQVTNAPLETTLRWYDEDVEDLYGDGDGSTSPSDIQLSSFEVMDHIIRSMLAKAPSITDVVLLGFSRGGRFTNRYSTGTRIETEYPNVRFRYVIGAAGGFVYLNGKRYVSNETSAPELLQDGTVISYTDNSVEPPVTRTCSKTMNASTFNKFPHGLNLSDRPADHYMAESAAAAPTIKERLRNKHRLFLVGEMDTDDKDRTCDEELQGSSRRNRAFNFVHHLGVEGAATNVGFCVIKGFKHDGGILISNAATAYREDGMVDCSLDDNRNDCVDIKYAGTYEHKCPASSQQGMRYRR